MKRRDFAQPGACFVTICTQSRECIFGEVVQGQMMLNGPGQMVESVWRQLPRHYPGVHVDAFVVMPNHVHGIIALVGAGPRAYPECSGVHNDGWQPFPGRLWQRNYYEHVIRNEGDLDHIRQHIIDNPARWDQDPENPNYRGMI
jgi:putative transposase